MTSRSTILIVPWNLDLPMPLSIAIGPTPTREKATWRVPSRITPKQSKLEPENPLAYLNRGEVYQNTLQKELAIADYKTILSLTCEPQYQDIARQRLLALGVKIISVSSSPALAIWQKKLEFLQTEEAKAADAEQKFSIQQRIEEAKAKIEELGG